MNYRGFLYFKPIIMKATISEDVEVNVKTLHLYLKVSDMFDCSISDDSNEEICDYSGYVPSFMPGRHYGDYVILDIDIDTGNIINWKVPTSDDMSEFINSAKNG